MFSIQPFLKHSTGSWCTCLPIMLILLMSKPRLTASFSQFAATCSTILTGCLPPSLGVNKSSSCHFGASSADYYNNIIFKKWVIIYRSYSWKFSPGNNIAFSPFVLMGELYSMIFFLSCINDYIEPMMIFTAWAKIYSVKIFL